MFSACTVPFLQMSPPQYYSPRSAAQYVSTGTTIVVRYGPELSDQDLEELDFTVEGEKSGLHTGRNILADDRETVIFKPDIPFARGEQVRVKVNSLRLGEKRYQPLSYTFMVAGDPPVDDSQERVPRQAPAQRLPRLSDRTTGHTALRSVDTFFPRRRRGYLCSALLLDRVHCWLLSAHPEYPGPASLLSVRRRRWTPGISRCSPTGNCHITTRRTPRSIS